MADLRQEERLLQYVHKSDESEERRKAGRGEKRRAQSRGMQPNHYNHMQLMTNAIAGVRIGSENAVFKV